MSVIEIVAIFIVFSPLAFFYYLTEINYGVPKIKYEGSPAERDTLLRERESYLLKMMSADEELKPLVDDISLLIDQHIIRAYSSEDREVIEELSEFLKNIRKNGLRDYKVDLLDRHLRGIIPSYRPYRPYH